MCSSRLRISMSLGALMSPAVISAGPRTSRGRTTSSSLVEVSTTSLMFSTMSVTSSAMPVIVSNSCRASSKRTAVIAAPGMLDSSVRRSELPMVWPKPGSSGPMAKRWRGAWSSPRASTGGGWVTSISWCLCVRGGRGLLGGELDDERLAHRHVDVIALGQIAHGDLLAAVAGLQPADDAAVERVDVVLDDDHLHRLGRELDGLALLDAVARDVDPLAVDLDETVADELAGLRTGAGPA